MNDLLIRFYTFWLEGVGEFCTSPILRLRGSPGSLRDDELNRLREIGPERNGLLASVSGLNVLANFSEITECSLKYHFRSLAIKVLRNGVNNHLICRIESGYIVTMGTFRIRILERNV